MAKEIIKKGKKPHKNKLTSKKYSKRGRKGVKEEFEISELEKELKFLKPVKLEKTEKDEEGKTREGAIRAEEESEGVEEPFDERFIEFFQPLFGGERRQELEQLEHSISFDLASPRIRSRKEKYEEKYDSKYEEKYEEKTPDYAGAVKSEKKETDNRLKSF